MDKEHVALASSSVGGEHVPGGSAVLFYDDTTAVDANVSADTFVHDSLLFDTTLNQFFTMNAAEDTKVAIEIGTAGIADANVTTALIADANITTALIADANITTALIADANITTALIADANITTALIADANVTVAKMLYKDEDDMASDSATHVATQQSIKAFVAAQIAAGADPTYEGGESHTFGGGLIVKMGQDTQTTTSVYTVTFGTAFPNALIALLLSGERSSSHIAYETIIRSKSASAFTWYQEHGTFTMTCHWVAIGYE